MKKLGFGFMRLPLLDAKNPTSVDLGTVCKMVDEFMEKGFTYFDTAYMYHDYKSECFLNEALVKRYSRGKFTVASKLPTMMLKEKSDMERIFNEQLEKCGVEYFDYYLVHNLTVQNYEIAQKLGAFEFVSEKKANGIVKHMGFSFHDKADLLDKILTEHPEVDFVQLQINYLDWDTKTVQSRKCYETAKKHGKRVIVMEPVKGGTLASVPDEAQALLKKCNPEMSTASWAIRFAASLENVDMVLSGMSDMNQLSDNASFMKDFVPLNKEEQDIIAKVVDIINASITIPCTACRYCVEGCPKNIPIPEYFSLYNNVKKQGKKEFYPEFEYYNGMTSTNGKASECISCGKCSKACPQHINIPNQMNEVAAMFEE